MASSPHVVNKPKRSTKPPSIKAQVIAKRVNGDSKRQIAHDVGISRQAVRSIINESDIDQQLQSGLVMAAQLIPKSIKVIDMRLDKGSESAAFGILNPLVLSRAAQANPQRMTADVNLQVAINALIQPAKAANEPVHAILEQAPASNAPVHDDSSSTDKT